VYYGSEYGIGGNRTRDSDRELRPRWDPAWERNGEDLFAAVVRCINIRKENRCLRNGAYRELFLSHEQFAFTRESEDGALIVAVNSSEEARDIVIPTEALQFTHRNDWQGRWRQWRDLLSGEIFTAAPSGLRLPLYPSWLRILRYEGTSV
jgi:glycosidase